MILGKTASKRRSNKYEKLIKEAVKMQREPLLMPEMIRKSFELYSSNKILWLAHLPMEDIKIL